LYYTNKIKLKTFDVSTSFKGLLIAVIHNPFTLTPFFLYFPFSTRLVLPSECIITARTAEPIPQGRTIWSPFLQWDRTELNHCSVPFFPRSYSNLDIFYRQTRGHPRHCFDYKLQQNGYGGREW